MNEPGSQRGAGARERTRRDVERWQRRSGQRDFWRSLALVGSVGWPIVLLATGGALFGRWLDTRLGSGIRFSLMLLTLGAGLGTFVAFRTLKGDGS